MVAQGASASIMRQKRSFFILLRLILRVFNIWAENKGKTNIIKYFFFKFSSGNSNYESCILALHVNVAKFFILFMVVETIEW